MITKEKKKNTTNEMLVSGGHLLWQLMCFPPNSCLTDKKSSQIKKDEMIARGTFPETKEEEELFQQ